MNIPIVSVVIPAYNRENKIVAAIQSVLSQGVDNIEVIVVDDCSTDGTVRAIETVSDPRVQLIKHAKNKGEAGARNTGCKHAQGTYIAYLDSDDQWLPGKLKAQLEVMEADSSIGGSYTLHERLYQNGRRSICGRPTKGQPLSFKTMLVKGANISAGNTLMFRRELFDIVGDYDETAPLYVDWDWLLRFLKVSDLVLIDQPYAVYEKNPLYRPGKVLERAKDIFINKFKGDIDRLAPAEHRECLSRIDLDIARGYAENESKLTALKYYFSALRRTPIMSAGSYINMFDGLTGANILSFLESKIKK